MKMTFDYIVDEAQSTHGMNIKQTAQWHYFNKNGVYAAKKASDERISKAVDAKTLKSGCILVYGSMNDFWTERLLEVVRGKRTTKSQLQNIVKYIVEDIKKANEVLAERDFNHALDTYL